MVTPHGVVGDDEGPSHSSSISLLRRGTSIVFAGSVLGYGVTYLVTPLLSRLVSPETFGLYSAVLAFASLFIGASTLRLEVFAASISSASHQRNARVLAVATAGAVSALVLLGAAAVWLIAGESPIWMMAGPMIFMGSLQLVATARYSVARAYPAMGIGNFIQGGGTGLAQLGLATLSPTAFSLIGGFLLARVHWLHALHGHGSSRMPMASTSRRARGFVRPAGASALLNSAGSQAPVLLLTAVLGAGGAGIFAMAVRLLVGPLAIVAQAIGSTALGEIGRLAAGRDSRLITTVDALIKQLAIMMLVPCALAAVLAPWLVPLVLGPGWEGTAVIVQVLTAGAFAQAVGSPLTQILNLTQSSRTLMGWDAARLATIVFTFLVIPLLGGGVTLVSVVYSASMIVLYTVSVILVRAACKRQIY